MSSSQYQNKDNTQPSSSWWEESMTRRDALMRSAGIGALFALSGIMQSCDSEPNEADALELQRTGGWNVGAVDKTLSFPNGLSEDSMNSPRWKSYITPAALLNVYEPKDTRWLPYFVPTLIQSLSSESLRAQLRPNFTMAMRTAYSRGLGMKELLKRAEQPEKTVLYCDLGGAESIAFAAALADVCEVIPTFDNFPHPLGIVRSHLTLASMMYYAAEIDQKRAKRPSGAPALFLLDSDRLTPYVDDGNAFDNRYVAKLPTSQNLRSLGITGVMYLSPDETRQQELDDLNDDFASYKESDIAVSMLPLSEFKPLQTGATPELSRTDPSSISEGTSEALPASVPDAAGAAVPVHYYGGGGSAFPWFFLMYAMMRPSPFFYPMWSPAMYGPMNRPSSLRQPNYTPVRRPTQFSSRTIGGQSGIGRTKPSGFGRVSSRAGSGSRYSTAVQRSSTTGRSGSWGRSGGWMSS